MHHHDLLLEKNLIQLGPILLPKALVYTVYMRPHYYRRTKLVILDSLVQSRCKRSSVVEKHEGST